MPKKSKNTGYTLKDLLKDENTAELKSLIIENPELPLVILCSKDPEAGSYAFKKMRVIEVLIEDLTYYGGGWLNREDFEEELARDLSAMGRHMGIVGKDLEGTIREKKEAAEFVRAIAVYVV